MIIRIVELVNHARARWFNEAVRTMPIFSALGGELNRPI